jgi:phage terminase large subunit GpA-like protein
MVEPMDMLKSRAHEAVVFVSPARTGKTQGLLDGWLSHCVTSDPGDMGLYFSTQTLAHDYRKRRIERMHRHSPLMREKLSARAHDTTIEMVIYRNGMIVNLGCPSSSQIAQRDLRYVAIS